MGLIYFGLSKAGLQTAIKIQLRRCVVAREGKVKKSSRREKKHRERTPLWAMAFTKRRRSSEALLGAVSCNGKCKNCPHRKECPEASYV